MENSSLRLQRRIGRKGENFESTSRIHPIGGLNFNFFDRLERAQRLFNTSIQEVYVTRESVSSIASVNHAFFLHNIIISKIIERSKRSAWVTSGCNFQSLSCLDRLIKFREHPRELVSNSSGTNIYNETRKGKYPSSWTNPYRIHRKLEATATTSRPNSTYSKLSQLKTEASIFLLSRGISLFHSFSAYPGI